MSSPVTYSTTTRPDDDKLLIKQPRPHRETLISSRPADVSAEAVPGRAADLGVQETPNPSAIALSPASCAGSISLASTPTSEDEAAEDVLETCRAETEDAAAHLPPQGKTPSNPTRPLASPLHSRTNISIYL